jgi:hypothetical protein
MKNINKQNMNTGVKLGGELITRVINSDGSIAYESPPTKNLVQYGGIEYFFTAGGPWFNMLRDCRAGDDSTTNSSVPAGTYSRSGTTVTRETGSVDFVVGDVGATIQFSGGEEAYINGFTNSSTVEVREFGSISATNITMWKTNLLDLGNTITTTTTRNTALESDVHDIILGTSTAKRVHNFAAEVGEVTYREVGYSYFSSANIFSRIVLSSPVVVGIGQQLQTEYTITFKLGDYIDETPITPVITGWPYPYEGTTITHSGTDFTVNLNKDHHYSVGDEITITNAVMPTVGVTSISSDASEFTVITAAANLYSVSDSILIEGTTVGGYTGTWTVASVTNATTFVVTEASNFGSATGGSTRNVPTPYFNNTWNIATIPTASSITVTDSTIATGNDAIAFDLKGTLSANARWANGSEPFLLRTINYNYSMTSINPADRHFLFFYTGVAPTLNGLGVAASGGGTALGPALQNQTVIRDTDTHEWGFSSTFSVTTGNSQEIIGVGLGTGGGIYNLSFQIVFDQHQRKDDGYTLELGCRMAMRPELA